MKGWDNAPIWRCLATIVCLAACATPVASAEKDAADRIGLPEGFRVELVYSVSLQEQGSWVSLTVDDQGRIIAGDQYGGLYRVSPSPIGAPVEQTKVARLPIKLGCAQGLLYAHDCLYV
ncbi:MAG: hypothetical protein AAF961_17980, partial [Planctomycetota bacterium]